MRRLFKHRFFPLGCIVLLLIVGVAVASSINESKKREKSASGAQKSGASVGGDTIYNKSFLNAQSVPVEKTSRAKKSHWLSPLGECSSVS